MMEMIFWGFVIVGVLLGVFAVAACVLTGRLKRGGDDWMP